MAANKNDLVVSVVAGVKLGTSGVVNQKEAIRAVSKDVENTFKAFTIDAGKITIDADLGLSAKSVRDAKKSIQRELDVISKSLHAKGKGLDISEATFGEMFLDKGKKDIKGAADLRTEYARTHAPLGVAELTGMKNARLAQLGMVDALQRWNKVGVKTQDLYNNFQKGDVLSKKQVDRMRVAAEAAGGMVSARKDLETAAAGRKPVREPVFGQIGISTKGEEPIIGKVREVPALTPTLATKGAAVPTGGEEQLRAVQEGINKRDQLAEKSATKRQAEIQKEGQMVSAATAKNLEIDKKAVDARAADRMKEAQARQADRDTKSKLIQTGVDEERKAAAEVAKIDEGRVASRRQAEKRAQPEILARRAAALPVTGETDNKALLNRNRVIQRGVDILEKRKLIEGSLSEYDTKRLAALNKAIEQNKRLLGIRKQVAKQAELDRRAIADTTARAARVQEALKVPQQKTRDIGELNAAKKTLDIEAKRLNLSRLTRKAEISKLESLKKLNAAETARLSKLKQFMAQSASNLKTINTATLALDKQTAAIKRNQKAAISGGAGGRIPPGTAAGMRDLADGTGNLRDKLGETGLLLRQFFRYALGYGALYKALAGITALTQGVIQLDKELKSIQAISQATEEQMLSIEAAVKGVATTTKFSVSEIAQAARTLAQAGVQPEDINNVLKSVAQFAAGTETALDTAADVASTMRNVFKDLDDVQIADKLTKAINISKLTGEDLKSILSISAQVAKSFELTSNQYLAAVTTLRNAGLKASTVATGLRQGLIELFNPKENFIKALKERYLQIGEGLNEGEIKKRFQAFQRSANPLLAALREMNRLGFTGEGRKTFARAFNVRSENAIRALIDNLDKLEEAEARISLGGSAAEASMTQMESLSNTIDNLGAAMTVLASDITEGPIEALQELAKEATNVINTLDQLDLDLEAQTGQGIESILGTAAAGAFAGATVPGGGGLRRLVGGVAGGAAGAYTGYQQGKQVQAGQISPEEMESTLSTINTLLTVLGGLSLLKGVGVGKITAAGAGVAVSKLKIGLGMLAGFFTSLRALGTGLIVVLTGFARANPVGLTLTGLWLAYEAWQAFSDDVVDEAAEYEKLQTRLKASKQRSTRARQELEDQINAFSEFQLTDYGVGVESRKSSSAEQFEQASERLDRAKLALRDGFLGQVGDIDKFSDLLFGLATGAASQAGTGARDQALESADRVMGTALQNLSAERDRLLSQQVDDYVSAFRAITTLAKEWAAKYDRLKGGTFAEGSANAVFLREFEKAQQGSPRLFAALKGDPEALAEIGGIIKLTDALETMYRAIGGAVSGIGGGLEKVAENYADEFKIQVDTMLAGLASGDLELTQAKNDALQEADKLSRTGVSSFENLKAALEEVNAKILELEQRAVRARETVAAAAPTTPEGYAEWYRQRGAEARIEASPVASQQARATLGVAPAQLEGLEVLKTSLEQQQGRLEQIRLEASAAADKQLEATYANIQANAAAFKNDTDFQRQLQQLGTDAIKLFNDAAAGDREAFDKLGTLISARESQRTGGPTQQITKHLENLDKLVTRTVATQMDTADALRAQLEQLKYAPSPHAALQVAELDIKIAALKKIKSPELFDPDSPIYKRAAILGREINNALFLVNENITKEAKKQDPDSFKTLQTLRKQQGKLRADRVKLDAATNKAVADEKFAYEKRALATDKLAISAENKANDELIQLAVQEGNAEQLAYLQQQRIALTEKLIDAEKAILLHAGITAEETKRKTKARRTEVAAAIGGKEAVEAVAVSKRRLKGVTPEASTQNIVLDAQRKAQGLEFTDREKLDSYRQSYAAISEEILRLQGVMATLPPGARNAVADEIERLNIQLADLEGNAAAISADPLYQMEKLFSSRRMLTDVQNLNSAMKNMGDTIREDVVGAIDQIGPALFDAVVDSTGAWSAMRSLAYETAKAIGHTASASLVNTITQKALTAFGSPQETPKLSKTLEAETPTTVGPGGGFFDGLFGPEGAIDTANIQSNAVYVNGPVVGGSVAPAAPLVGPVTLPGMGAPTSGGEETSAVMGGMLQNLETQTQQGTEAIQAQGGWFANLGTIFMGGLSRLGTSIAGLFGSSPAGQAGSVGAQGLLSMVPSLFAAGGAEAIGTGQGYVSSAGVISGPGTGTSDAIAAALFSPGGVSPVAISAGESILTAKATTVLGTDRIAAWNRGVIRGFAGGMVPANTPGKSSTVNVAAPNVNASTRIINVVDPALVKDYLASSEGEKVILNTIQRNPSSIKQSLR